ncbi:phage terminase small subunit P27 family [Clostridium sp. 19966]|uniref:phage terminase small subunit P27 family n=1 Tax=Clostridium sp. 19966 TaxID=2768166 RepID=UPI0028DD8E1A|nr:phage terminase small subunit P27 family [Clostridium sp. 19966]MDT8718994.1 phage terminase small subunit P27 family [Clostridium sp. 19966]
MPKIKCPAWLDLEAKKEWKRIISELEVDGEELQQIDIKALEGYCQSYAKWKNCEETLQEEGYTFTTPNGYVQQRPEIAISNKALADMRAWAKELGFTPAARSRMNKNNSSISGANDDEEMEDMVIK